MNIGDEVRVVGWLTTEDGKRFKRFQGNESLTIVRIREDKTVEYDDTRVFLVWDKPEHVWSAHPEQIRETITPLSTSIH